MRHFAACCRPAGALYDARQRRYHRHSERYHHVAAGVFRRRSFHRPQDARRGQTGPGHAGVGQPVLHRRGVHHLGHTVGDGGPGPGTGGSRASAGADRERGDRQHVRRGAGLQGRRGDDPAGGGQVGPYRGGRAGVQHRRHWGRVAHVADPVGRDGDCPGRRRRERAGAGDDDHGHASQGNGGVLHGVHRADDHHRRCCQGAQG